MALRIRAGASVTLHSAAASLPAPSGLSAGGAVPKPGGYASDAGILALYGAGTLTLAGAYLAGLDEVTEIWLKLIELNERRDISLTATLGYAQRVVGVAMFRRLCVTGTPSASTVTAIYTSLEELG